MRPMVTAGVATGGAKGRKLNIENETAGLSACGARWRFPLGILVFASVGATQASPSIDAS